ncbi:Elongation factor Tu, partial [Haemophilus influenzae]
MRHYQILR